MSPQPPLREPERENWNFFLTIPEIDRRRDQGPDHPPATGAGAAVRVLRRLLRLRRDAVHQAGDAAVRRPYDRRQRDRLLVDLRRQPADDAVDTERRRTRSGMVELAVRRQRRVRPRLSPVDRLPADVRLRAAEKAGRRRWRRSGARHPDGRAEGRSRHLRAARARRRSEGEAARHRVRTMRGSCSAWPTCW